VGPLGPPTLRASLVRVRNKADGGCGESLNTGDIHGAGQGPICVCVVMDQNKAASMTAARVRSGRDSRNLSRSIFMRSPVNMRRVRVWSVARDEQRITTSSSDVRKAKQAPRRSSL